MFHSIIQKRLGLTPNDKLYRQAFLLLSIQVVASSVLLFYVIFNLFVTHLYLIMALEIISLLTIYISWYILTRKKDISLSSTILLATIFLLTILFFFDQKHHDYALAQAVMFPVLCIYLKGFRLGTIYSTLYILIVLSLAFTGINTWEAVPFTATSFTNLTFTYIVVVLVIYYYEFSRSEAFDIIESSNKELHDYKENLEEKVEKALEEKRYQEAILVQQSKMAVMGEMIASIAHQWKQPLSTVASIANTAKLKNNLSIQKDGHICETFDSILTQVEYMDQTIADFSNFFRPKKKKEFFPLSRSIDDILKILKPQLTKYQIKVQCNEKQEKLIVEGYRSEFSQVLLNILTNAKDAILENINKGNISEGEGKVNIDAYFEDNKIRISICDNGGGIPDDIMHNIFTPYFTTKSEELGTGIGLYMSKMIIDSHMKGDITAKNIENGFCIELQLQGVEKRS